MPPPPRNRVLIRPYLRDHGGSYFHHKAGCFLGEVAARGVPWTSHDMPSCSIPGLDMGSHHFGTYSKIVWYKIVRCNVYNGHVFFCVFWTGYTQGSLCCVIMCCALCVECNVAERFGQICFLVEFGAVDSLNSSNPVAKASLFLPVFCRLFKHAWIQPWKPTRDRLPNTCKTWWIYDWTQKKNRPSKHRQPQEVWLED